MAGNCMDEPVISTFFPPDFCTGNSCIILPLNLDTSSIGVLQLFAKGRDRYTLDDVRLLSTITRPFAISLANARKYIELLQIREELISENRQLKKEIKGTAPKAIIGKESGLKNVFEMVKLVAPLKNPILLLGETGTGKEVIADFIHYMSMRKDEPFVKVNCGAIPPTILDSELFGHEKGSFTGAMEQSKGKFERANHGTIFLDEVGELTPDAQVRLLRVLDEHTIERVGGSETITVDIRVISATHRNLEEMIENNEFREDLYFRLNAFPIFIPPLRERKEDISKMVYYFLKNKAQEMGLREIPAISGKDFDRLTSHDWPGNVRELQNIVERALIIGRSKDMLDFSTLLPSIIETSYNDGASGFGSIDDNMAAYIRIALKRTNGRISGPGGAAELLNIHPSTLRNRMIKLGLL